MNACQISQGDGVGARELHLQAYVLCYHTRALRVFKRRRRWQLNAANVTRRRWVFLTASAGDVGHFTDF